MRRPSGSLYVTLMGNIKQMTLWRSLKGVFALSFTRSAYYSRLSLDIFTGMGGFADGEGLFKNDKN